ncbi:MAG: hypothetical protein WCC21_04015 [Candidatus Acidiferrales bacterium]
MRNKILFVFTVTGFFFAAMSVPAAPLHASPSAAQGAAASSPCDRSCLNGFVNQYIDALVAHDPSRLAVTRFVKYTENGQHIELGDGFWRTATGKGGYKFYVDDPEAGQVGFEGTMQEAGHPVIVALRLKIENQKISEIEMIVARGGMAEGGAANLEKLGKPRAGFDEEIPAAERVSRLDLIKTANKYFSGMQKDDGKGDYSFFGDDCNRLENGMQTTNNMTPMGGMTSNGTPRPAPSAKYDPSTNPTSYSAGWSCRDQFRSGLLHFVSLIRDRRYPIVDQEHGIVWAFGFFDHQAGETRNFETPDGRPVTAGPTTPFTWEIAEIFKVRHGQLHEIEAALTQGAYGMCSGWSSYEQCRSDQPQW